MKFTDFLLDKVQDFDALLLAECKPELVPDPVELSLKNGYISTLTSVRKLSEKERFKPFPVLWKVPLVEVGFDDSWIGHVETGKWDAFQSKYHVYDRVNLAVKGWKKI